MTNTTSNQNDIMNFLTPDLLVSLEEMLGMAETLFFVSKTAAGSPIRPDHKAQMKLDRARGLINQANFLAKF